MITNSTKKIRELSFENFKRNMTNRAIRLVVLCAFMFSSFQILAQGNHKVTGKITAASDNSGVPGANVIVKGTTNGTATDVDGNYSIEASESDVLVFSYIGYETQEITVGGKTVINVSMMEDISKLSEVVVVGYGQMKKSTITGAQTSVKAADIEKTVNTTVEQAIQGRSAGVYITQNSGQPGGGISVNIRGVNSINGTNEPLYVIDGVQMMGQSASGELLSTSTSNPLAGLNPADIESIEVLQGPSATAIYGSRGTNGVLLITTKRGKAGDTKVSYGYQYSVQTEPKKLDVMNLREYAQMVKEYHEAEESDTPDEFLDPSLLGEGTDWQEELFNNAPMNKHQLSLSGGGDKTTYYLSGEYLTQAGIALGSGFDRYSIRLNVDNKARKWLTLGTNLSFNQTDENLTMGQENILSNVLQLSPQIPVRNFDGTYGGPDVTNGANQYSPVNPIAIANLTTNDLVRRQFLGGLNAAVDIIPGLTFRTSFNTNLNFGNSTYFVPKYKIGYNENVTASLSERSSTNTYWNWNQLLQYDKQLGKHFISLMASHESQASTYKNVTAQRTSFLTNDLIDLELGDIKTSSTGGGYGEWAMESYLGRLNYNYDERYILNGTIRADGSVNFGPDNRWGVFPSVSAAWRISKESFFNIPVINELKLRVETGTTGNQGGSGGIYSRMRTGATAWGTGFLPENYGNPMLQWEETKTNNIGMNLALFQNRIQLEFDYYIKKTDNLLMTQPLPGFMGTSGQGAANSPEVNIGGLENKGWGLTLNTVNLDRGGFKWESNFNISAFKTKITEFYSDAAFVGRQSWWLQNWEQRAVVGEAPWLFRGYVYDGLFQSQEDLENSALPVDNNGNELPIENTAQGIWVGDVKYRDISGPEGKPDGKITVDDQTNIGNPWPKLFAGFTNTFSYKGVTLSVLITSTQGNDIYNLNAKVNTNPNNINTSRNLLADVLEYAKPVENADGNTVLANPGTDIPRFSFGQQDNYAVHSSRWVEDGSFIRLKNISLTYNLPSNLLSKQKIVKGARVSFSAQNVATITGYSGYDPEVGAYVGRDVTSQNQAIGLDFGRYPLTPVYSFGVGIDF